MRILYTLICSLFCTGLFAQDFTGSWGGNLNIQGASLDLIFHLTQNEQKIKGTLEVPQQKVQSMPIDKVDIVGDSVFLEIKQLNLKYYGKKIDEDSIQGQFEQRTFKTSMVLKKNSAVTKVSPVRPQTPVDFSQYLQEDITILNFKDGIHIKGTLTRPLNNNSAPLIILISGSGPQNRNGEVLGHQPFLVLSDYFTKKGFAVFRYDERGVGASEGDFAVATSLNFKDDVVSMVKYFSQSDKIDNRKINLIGHSEGGIIAPMVANELGKLVHSIILLGAPTESGKEIIQQQLIDLNELDKKEGKGNPNINQVIKLNGLFFNVITDCYPDKEKIVKTLDSVLHTVEGKQLVTAAFPGMENQQALIDNLKNSLNPWTIFFVTYNPEQSLKNLKCPVLALYGDKDVQVNAEINAPRMKKFVKGSLLTLKVLPEHNHLFQHSSTGSVQEYATIEETFSVEAMDIMSAFLKRK